MNKEYDFVDKIMYSYFENKDVPKNIEETIRNTEVTKNNNIFFMQPKWVAVILIIPVLFGIAYFIKTKDVNDNNVLIAQKNETISENNVITTPHEYPEPQYLNSYTVEPTTKNLYKLANLVIIGKSNNKNKSYVDDTGTINTISGFNVLEVLKGNYSSQEINVEYMGGIVPLRELMEKFDSDRNKKYGFSDLTDEEIEKRTFEIAGLKVYSDTEYIIFLGYDKERNVYSVYCDQYGVRELSNNRKIYNPDTKNFEESIEELIKK